MLNKLKALHPLPGLILEWRRISNAITKVVFPLQREKRLNPFLRMERLYPVSQSHTATGERYEKTFICNICDGPGTQVHPLWGSTALREPRLSLSPPPPHPQTQLDTTWTLGRPRESICLACAPSPATRQLCSLVCLLPVMLPWSSSCGLSFPGCFLSQHWLLEVA